MMLDLLKLADETDLDILNRSMEVMVEAFQNELLPVAAQLTARLVSVRFFAVYGVWFLELELGLLLPPFLCFLSIIVLFSEYIC
jgi:hypothetical protein